MNVEPVSASKTPRTFTTPTRNDPTNSHSFRVALAKACQTEGSSSSRETQGVVRHTVNAGETLSEICLAHLKHLGTVQNTGELYAFVDWVAKANNIADPDLIFPGQDLLLPVANADPQPQVAPCAAPASEALTEFVATTPPPLYALTLPLGLDAAKPEIPSPSSSAASAPSPAGFHALIESLLESDPLAGLTSNPASPWRHLLGARARLTSEFGLRPDPFTGEIALHTGIDLAAEPGTEIRSLLPGKVLFSGWKPEYGKVVIVRHDGGLETLYGHNSENIVVPGQDVRAGTPLGLVGSTGRSTGPHLHFEVRENRQPIDPIPVVTRQNLQLAQAK